MSSVLNDSIFNPAYLLNFGMPAVGPYPLPSVDVLCDELTLHTFECDTCIAGNEDKCPTFCSLREQIAEAGGPTKGVCLSM
ncbi:MAG TPA: hypothetical protein VHZ55_07210 [Bryobacteraceae bacterium]|nr:hypothetical protein [Bryobacteraceae bacterium]